MTISITRSASPNPAPASSSSIVLSLTFSTSVNVDSAASGGDSIQLGVLLPTALYTSASVTYSIGAGPTLGPVTVFGGIVRLGVGNIWTTAENAIITVTMNGVTATPGTYALTPRVESYNSGTNIFTVLQSNAYNVVVSPPPSMTVRARFVQYASYAALDAAIAGMTPEDRATFLDALPSATSVVIGKRWLLYCVIENDVTLLEDTPFLLEWSGELGDTYDTNGPYEHGVPYAFPADIAAGSTTVFLSDSGTLGPDGPAYWRVYIGDDDDIGNPSPIFPYGATTFIEIEAAKFGGQAILV